MNLRIDKYFSLKFVYDLHNPFETFNNVSFEVAYENRICFSPHSPNAEPGTVATWAFQAEGYTFPKRIDQKYKKESVKGTLRNKAFKRTLILE